MTPSTEESPRTRKVAKSTNYRKRFKWLGIFGAVGVLLVFSLLLLLTVFFPSELVREELEVRLSGMLQGTVRVHSLSFNLITGLELNQVTVSKDDQSLLALETLILDYNLLELLQRRLKINEIRLEGADVSLNLPALQASMARTESPPSPSEGPAEIPSIPVEINLTSLVMSKANLSVILSPDLSLMLRGLNVAVSGGVTGDTASLDGSVRVEQVAVEMREKQLRLPFDLDFNLLANLTTQAMHFDRLTVASHPAFRSTLSGDITNFLGEPSVDLVLRDTQVDVAGVRQLVEDVVPQEFRDVAVSGLLSPHLTVKGSLTASGFQGVTSLDLALNKFTMMLPQFDVTVSPIDVTVKVSDVTVTDNLPESATLNLTVATKQATFQDYRVANINLQVSGDYFAVGPVSATVTLTGTPSLPGMGGLSALTIPVSVDMETVGNHRVQELTLKELVVSLGQLVDIEAQGFVRPQTGDSSPIQVLLTAKVEPHIDQLLTMIPPDLLPGLAIQKYTAPDTVLVKAEGLLDTGYVPQEGKVSVQTHLSKIDFAQAPLAVEGKLEDMHLMFSTAYHAGEKELSGTVSGTLSLSNLAYGGIVRLGQLGMTLGSSFAGSLSPSFGLADMRAKDTVTVAMGDLRYDTPSLRASLDELTLSTKTHEDLVRQDFSLDELRLSSGTLFQLRAVADYRRDSQTFHANMVIPTLNVGELLRHVSGEGVEALQGIQPSGEIEMSFTTAGRVPGKDDVEKLDIPLRINTKLLARSISGVFARHRVRNAAATVLLDFTPGDLPLAGVKTQVSVDDIQLAPGLPVDRLSESSVNLDLSVKNFDEVDIRTMRLATRGAEASVRGKVAGVREFLESNPVMSKAVGNLFANLQVQAQVALDEFQQILTGVGLVGSGQARVGLSVIKKEQGMMELQLEAGGQGMSVSREGLRVDNLNGHLDVKKRLGWIGQTPRRSRRFNPTDVLARLRSKGQKSQRIGIDLLDLGFVTIRDFSTFIGFEENALKIQNLSMNVLGGGVGGNVVVTTGQAFGLSGRFEAARLDLNHLLEDRLKIMGDSLVDSTIGISVFFDERTGALDLSRTELNLFITHIGPKALDRVLVFLDPDGSNPTLVNARSQIKLANPSRVTIQLVRGMMNLEILFSEGLMPPFRLNRIPVGKLKNIQAVTETLPNWEKIRDVMLLAGAETYGVDEQGQWMMK